MIYCPAFEPVPFAEELSPLQGKKFEYGVSITPEIQALLASGAAVAVGVSGGKDSDAVALRLAQYLDEIRHTGPRVLIHSDLGRVEWKDSLPVCEKIAQRLGWELLVVRRAAGDMMDRWWTRWANNVERYRTLSCVRLILPWSTPSMRFCTSELKTCVLCSALKKRFPGLPVISVSGIRRQESTSRAKAPVAQIQPKLMRKGIEGWNWNPIIEWETPEVYAYLAEIGAPLHEAYTQYQSTRVSCCYCVMASAGDLIAATRCADNHSIYREMVELETVSTFSFQGNTWLGDVAPDLLTPEACRRLMEAKEKARLRIEAEARLPKHLLYSAGWPASIPTLEEAALLGSVRVAVGAATGIEVLCTTSGEIRDRYAELISLRQAVGLLDDSEREAA